MNAVRPAENPFASHRVEGLSFRTGGPGLPDLVARLDELGGRAAIVGIKGSGKTTLLEEMSRALPAPITWIRIPGGIANAWHAAQRQIPGGGTHRPTVLVDGAEQLGAFAWRRLLRRVGGARYVVATLHKPGRLPTLIGCRTRPALLRELVEELAPNDLRYSGQTLDDLFQRHKGNIRLCFRDLYDRYAGRGDLEF